jgi:hypothetical protein
VEWNGERVKEREEEMKGAREEDGGEREKERDRG